MTTPHVEADFRRDWYAFVRQVLTSWGYPPDASESDEALCWRMFNLAKRLVEPRARVVLEAKEFMCPPEHLTGWHALRKKFEKGEDVVPHLSVTVGNEPDYYDDLLNDWGIHHLHLGVAPYPKDERFLQRTGPLVFGRVTATHFFAAGVFPHGAWTRKEILEIVWRNWPDVLEPYRIFGVAGLSHVPTDKEHAKLRAAGVTVLVQLSDGTVLAPPGGGINTAGGSVWVVTESDKHLRLVDACEEWVQENAELLVKEAEASGKRLTYPLRLRLVVEESGWYALGEGAKVAFRLPIG